MQINPIRFSGLASGLDTESIVKELMNAHRIPLTRLQQQRQLLEWQKEAYREVNQLMTNFRNVVAPLRLQSTFLVKAASVSDPLVANVKASNQTFDGTYTLKVESLAKGASVTSGKTNYQELNNQLAVDPSTIGNVIYINGVEIQLTGNTVASFVADVNAKSSETGVQVSFDLATQRFYFKTIHTGEKWTYIKDGVSETRDVKIDFFHKDDGSRIVYDPNDGNSNDDKMYEFLTQAIGIDGNLLVDTDPTLLPDTDDRKKILTGQNAKIYYQGSDVIEFATNSFTINGMNVQLKGTGEVTITVSPDTDAIFNAIKTFVDEYNKLVDEVNKKLQEPRYRDYPPLTQEQKEEMTEKEIELWEERAKSGMIRNDSMITSIMSQMRMAVYGTVEGSVFKHLSSIHIEAGSYVDEEGKLVYGQRGKLYIKDENALRQLISENPDEVMKLFTVNDTSNENNVGIGWRMYNLANKAIKQLEEKAGFLTGYSLVDNSTLGERIKDMDERIGRMQNRLITIEQRYWAQFTALERAIAQMNMQSAWLAQTFGGGSQ